MLSDAKRLKTRDGYGYLVSWKDKLRVESEAQASELAKRILADAYNVEQIRQGLGRPTATLDELEEWLASGLAAKALVALRTKPRPRVFDEQRVTNLMDLLPPEEPPEPAVQTGYIDIRLTEHDGTPAPDEPYRIVTPDFEEIRGSLDTEGHAHHDPVARSVCRVSFPNIDQGDWQMRPGPPQPKPPFLDVIVTDEEGTPVAGAPWELELPGGVNESGIADASGRIFIPNLEFATVGRLVVTHPPAALA